MSFLFEEETPAAAVADAKSTVTAEQTTEQKPSETQVFTASFFQGINKLEKQYQGRIKKSPAWTARCLRTHVPGFDEQLIFSVENGKVKADQGGLPLGSPGLTVMGGEPGAGKSQLCYAITAQCLAHGESVQFHTFEKPHWVVFFQVMRMIDAYGLQDKVKIERTNGEIIIPNFEVVDEWHSIQKRSTMPQVVQYISKWHEETKGRLVVIDSLTDMTSGEALPERQLALGLKSFLLGLANNLSVSDEIAVLGTSQHRGNFRDAHFAGGPAIAHKGNATIKIDADFVNQFDRRYFNRPRGTMVRTIRVIKTADHPHSSMEHFYDIDATGKCVIGEAIASVTMTCVFEDCHEFVNYEKDEYVSFPNGGIAHLSCYLRNRQGAVPADRPKKLKSAKF